MIGQALEEMLESDGWKHLDKWLESHEAKAMSDLKTKKFTDLSDVKALQTRISFIREMRGAIEHDIKRGKAERQMQV